MKSQRFDKYKGKYLRETKAAQSLSSLIQDSFMILVQLVLRGGRVKYAHGYNWRTSFNIKPFDFDNNVSHTKRNVSYFSAKKHRLHDQISANSNHINMDDGKTERDKSGWGQYRQGLLLGTYSPPFSLSLLLLVVVCKEWGISNMKLNYLSAAALHWTELLMQKYCKNSPKSNYMQNKCTLEILHMHCGIRIFDISDLFSVD